LRVSYATKRFRYALVHKLDAHALFRIHTMHTNPGTDVFPDARNFPFSLASRASAGNINRGSLPLREPAQASSAHTARNLLAPGSGSRAAQPLTADRIASSPPPRSHGTLELHEIAAAHPRITVLENPSRQRVAHGIASSPRCHAQHTAEPPRNSNVSSLGYDVDNGTDLNRRLPFARLSHTAIGHSTVQGGPERRYSEGRRGRRPTDST
jgi:hypothetical protein